MLFRWRIEPGASGSPIRSVTITRTSGEGPKVNYSSTRSIGEYAVSISSMRGEGRSIYSLIATDEKHATTTKKVVFEVKSIVSVREDISMKSLQTEPAQIREGEPFTFILKLNNRSGLRIPDVNIPIWSENASVRHGFPEPDSEPPPPNQGELSNQIIEPGMNEYRLRCTPGIPTGLAHSYLFKIIPSYKRIFILNIRVSLEFFSGNLYKIRVTH